MSTRRRIGISTATSEAARRQLMQPVPCWEKVWATPADALPGSTLKVYKWIKTDRKQNFSDEEDEADEPLAPLPDEPESNDAEEEMDQDDPATSIGPDTTSRAVSEPLTAPPPEDTLLQDAVPPKPHPLSISLAPPSPSEVQAMEADDGLDTVLSTLEGVIDASDSLEHVVPPSLATDLDPEGMVSLDMSQLGPDGTQFEGSHDLTQMQGADLLLGGEVMDESADPFSAT